MMGNKTEFWMRLEKLTDGKIEESNKQLNRAKIAKEIGTNPTTFSEWIKGNKEPQMKSAVALADYFNVSLDYLFGRSDYKHKENETVTMKDIGLSEEAVDNLQRMLTDDKHLLRSMDILLESNELQGLLHGIKEYMGACCAIQIYELVKKRGLDMSTVEIDDELKYETNFYLRTLDTINNPDSEADEIIKAICGPQHVGILDTIEFRTTKNIEYLLRKIFKKNEENLDRALQEYYERVCK